MKILTDKQFNEEIKKAIAEEQRNERIELNIKRLDDRIDLLMSRLEELHFRLASAERKEE